MYSLYEFYFLSSFRSLFYFHGKDRSPASSGTRTAEYSEYGCTNQNTLNFSPLERAKASETDRVLPRRNSGGATRDINHVKVDDRKFRLLLISFLMKGFIQGFRD